MIGATLSTRRYLPRFVPRHWRGGLPAVAARRNLSIAVFFAVIVAVIYIVTLVSAPIGVMTGFAHDDGLYIKLGAYLARGMWLGPFDQFTLMKGPGYPVFLAAANRL